jgi:hypothetical protein
LRRACDGYDGVAGVPQPGPRPPARPLSYALLKNIVPDFPLCNKSFNQSYSGNDL